MGKETDNVSLSVDECDLVLQAGCCMAAVDGRLSRGEILCIEKVLTAAGAPPAMMTEESILQVAKRVHRDGAEVVGAYVRERLTWGRGTQVSDAIAAICDAMKAMAPEDGGRLSRVCATIIPSSSTVEQPAGKARAASKSASEWAKPATLFFQGSGWNQHSKWWAWTLAATAATLVGNIQSTIRKHLDEAAVQALQLGQAELKMSIENAHAQLSLPGLPLAERQALENQILDDMGAQQSRLGSVDDNLRVRMTTRLANLFAALVTGIATCAAAVGAFLCFRAMQSTRDGTVVPVAFAFCGCLFMLYKHLPLWVF